MGAPSTHGQRNKTHKTSRSAGVSARKKQRLAKEGGAARTSLRGSAAPGGKVERMLASKHNRDTKRAELLNRKRHAPAPIVVAILPLSADVDVSRLWAGLQAACEASCSASGAAGGSVAGRSRAGSVAGRSRAGSEDGAGGMDFEMPGAASSSSAALSLVTLPAHVRSRLRLTLLPPPSDREDPLAVVELAKSAEVLLLALAGSEGQSAVDSEGHMALAIFRAMGLPGAVAVVQQRGGAEGEDGGDAKQPSLKDRSAAKRRAEKAIAAELSGDQRVLHADTTVDFSQLLRHLAEAPPAIPLWRQQRPSLLVESATFRAADATQDAAASTSAPDASTGTLLLTGYVRYAGLSANQLITIPGAGDFQIDCIEAPEEPVSTSGRVAGGVGGGAGGGGSGGGGGRAGGAGAGGAGGMMDVSGGAVRMLAHADPNTRESVVRENIPGPLEGEQTWPTHEELMDAAKFSKQTRRKRVPAGTSEYQAAWIPDESDDEDGLGGSSSDSEEGDEGDAAMRDGGDALTANNLAGGRGGGEDDTPLVLDDDAGSDGMMLGDDDGGDEDEAAAAARADAEYAEAKASRRRKEEDELDFPDEVDVPIDAPARIRFQKFRGLKSFRSSPWDPKESLPIEYARVFAFENPKRAHRRALDAVARATSGADPCAVAPGTYVTLHVSRVPQGAAQGIVQRVQATAQPGAESTPPLVVFGLLQHESKISVLHLGLQLAKGYEEPLRNKEQLLMVTGLRSFVAQPILSADDHAGDKFKMDKFLHAGRHTMSSCYAPISYGPLPTLAFKVPEGGGHARLAATGRLRGCDPDRVVLKKIVLAGYPVRVQKKRAVVRFMFHHPDDIRWFQPVELVTKGGRRGRITEPIGTHGAMKCLFDGVVQQNDAVCMPLYKRVFPAWPKDLESFSL